MKPVYRCEHCGAACNHPIWAALQIADAEGTCPACLRWSKFHLVDEAAARPRKQKAA